MGIKVFGPDPAPQLTVAGPNQVIPQIAPFPALDEIGETMAVSTFNSGGASSVALPDNNPIDGIIPGANTPLPDASTILPARIMMGIPFTLMQGGSPVANPGSAPPPITFSK